MYHLYNLIVAGDEVESSTVRNVTRESKTGSIQKERIRMVLTISVVRVEYDAEQGMYVTAWAVWAVWAVCAICAIWAACAVWAVYAAFRCASYMC